MYGPLNQARSSQRAPPRQFSPTQLFRPQASRFHTGPGQSSQTGSKLDFSSQFHGLAAASSICQMCNKVGHTAPYCASIQFLSPQVHYAEASFVGFYDLNWYMDSSATNHVTSNLSNLSIKDECLTSDHIFTGDGTSLPILSSGSSSFYSVACPLHLQDILYTPHISKKLVSISQFTRNNSCSIEFHPNFFVVKDLKTHREILGGPVKDDLYCLSSGAMHSPQVLLSTANSSTLWH